MWLVFADFFGHLFAFLMGLLLAFLFIVTDCHVLIMVLAGLLPIMVRRAFQFGFLLLSGGRNLVAFRCILSVTLLTILSVTFLLKLSVTFHIAHFLSDPGVPGPIYGSSCLSLSHRPFADLTDVSLALWLMKLPTQF